MNEYERHLRVLAWPARKNQGENPYNMQLYDSLRSVNVDAIEFDGKSALRANVDLVHIHWPDGILKTGNPILAVAKLLSLMVVILYWRAVRRKPIVWTVHNYGPHGARHPALANILYWFLSRNVSLLIHMNIDGKAEVERRLPSLRRLPYAIIPIGLYAPMMGHDSGQRPQASPKVQTGRPLTIGYVGRIEPYKGALVLSEAFRKVPSSYPCELKIIGGCQDLKYLKHLQDSVAKDSRQELVEGWLENQQMIDWIQRCDLIVIPYSAVLNSSSIMLPVELGVPVLAPSMGSLKGVAAKIGSNWLSLYSGELTADTLLWASTLDHSNEPDLSEFNWNSIARETRASYESVLA